MQPTHTEHDTTHLHAHLKGDAQHTHSFEGRSQSILAWALCLTLSFAGIEVAAGFMSNSLALISDAGHMVTDAAALGLALLAQLIARRPPSPRHSFGFGRAEALAAFVNGLAMLCVVGWICYEAVLRFSAPQPVKGGMVFIVAFIGLAINVVVAWVLSKDKQSVNTRAALVHVMGESYHFLMEGVPMHIDYIAVGTDVEQVDGVIAVHDLHVWDMSPGQPALIGHVEIEHLDHWPKVMRAIKTMLLAKHGIDHITLQPETATMAGLHAGDKTHQQGLGSDPRSR